MKALPLGAASGLVFLACSAALRRDEPAIERALAEKVPLNSDTSTVSGFLAREGYRIFEKNVRADAALIPGPNPFQYRNIDSSADSYTRAILGEYRSYFLFPTTVVADWMFDKDARLIRIRVTKDVDAF